MARSLALQDALGIAGRQWEAGYYFNGAAQRLSALSTRVPKYRRELQELSSNQRDTKIDSERFNMRIQGLLKEMAPRKTP